MDVHGKEVLAGLGADRMKVAQALPPDKIPRDIVDLLDELDQRAD